MELLAELLPEGSAVLNLVAAPLSLDAQEARNVYRIGVLSYGGGAEPASMEAFQG